MKSHIRPEFRKLFDQLPNDIQAQSPTYIGTASRCRISRLTHQTNGIYARRTVSQMISHTEARFWKFYGKLAPEIQEHADRAYELWKSNPFHPSLQFKRVDPKDPLRRLPFA